jgi:hypothetical protein
MYSKRVKEDETVAIYAISSYHELIKRNEMKLDQALNCTARSMCLVANNKIFCC